jgi:hypothetical protein
MSAVHFRQTMIIQDADGTFLAPSETGDVCFVRDVSKAGRFYDLEQATESAEMYCDRYTIFPFYTVRPNDEVN